MGSPRKLRNCETKSLGRRNVIPLPFPSFFSIAEVFWKTEVFPHDYFWSCQTTKLRQIVIPLFSNFFSDTRAFLKHKGSHYETFLYSGTEKVSPENRGTPSLIRSFFPFQGISEIRKVPPRRLLALWDYKLSTENRDTLLLSIILLILEIFWKNERFPYKFSRHCEKKSFRRKNVITLLYFIIFSFLELSGKIEGFQHEIFWHCGTQKFWRKVVIPS